MYNGTIFFFLSVPLSKTVSVHNETKRHITELALPGSEIYFFDQPGASVCNSCGLMWLSGWHLLPGNENRDVVSTPLGGHAHPIHRTQLRHQGPHVQRLARISY